MSNEIVTGWNASACRAGVQGATAVLSTSRGASALIIGQDAAGLRFWQQPIEHVRAKTPCRAIWQLARVGAWAMVKTLKHKSETSDRSRCFTSDFSIGSPSCQVNDADHRVKT